MPFVGFSEEHRPPKAPSFSEIFSGRNYPATIRDDLSHCSLMRSDRVGSCSNCEKRHEATVPSVPPRLDLCNAVKSVPAGMTSRPSWSMSSGIRPTMGIANHGRIDSGNPRRPTDSEDCSSSFRGIMSLCRLLLVAGRFGTLRRIVDGPERHWSGVDRTSDAPA